MQLCSILNEQNINQSKIEQKIESIKIKNLFIFGSSLVKTESVISSALSIFPESVVF